MKNKTINVLNHWGNLRFRLFFEGLLVGLLAGSIVILYRIVLEKADVLRNSIFTLIKAGPWWGVILLLALLIPVGYIIGLIGQKEPMIAGSGIPQVKGILISRLKMNWFSVIIYKFIGGVLAIGAGMSLGREGPSVQLGAAAGQGISRLLGRLRLEEKYLITSGASAGLAAAFNAPLAGVIFALEELHKNFSPAVLLSAMAASLSADFLSQRVFGLRPIFNYQGLPPLPLEQYPYLLILGIIIGVLGLVFNSSLIKTLDLYKKLPFPKVWYPVIPLLVAGVLGLFLPEVLGGGHHLVNALGSSSYPIKFLLLLLLAKFAFTLLSYGSGAPGGIFLPLLVLGSLIGNIFGDLLSTVSLIESTFIRNFIVLSMAAYFTAIVKAPITGSILITEMTGSFSHLLAMATVSITAYLVTDLLKSHAIYDILLERIMLKKGKQNFVGDKHNKILIEVAISLGSQLDGKRVRDITWPKKCLLVAIRRGEKEIIPKGDDFLAVGDYVVVLTNENKEAETRAFMTELASNTNH